MSEADKLFEKMNYEKQKHSIFADGEEHDTIVSYQNYILNESIEFYLGHQKVYISPSRDDGNNTFELDTNKLKAITKKAEELEWF